MTTRTEVRKTLTAVGAAALLLTCGLAQSAHAQLGQPRPDRGQQGNQQQGGQDESDTQRQRLEALDRLRRQREQALENEGRGPDELAPVEQLVGENGAQRLGDLQGVEGTVTLDFGQEAVDLLSFAAYVGRALEINIFSDPGLQGRAVQFLAPVEVEVSELLVLLSELLAPEGYALSQHPLGWYEIVPIQELRVNPGDALGGTRVIRTPGVRPSAIQTLITPALGQNAAQNIRITALDELGILLVTGSKANIDMVESLVDAVIEKRREIQPFTVPFQNISAATARDRILLLTGEGTGGQTSNVNRQGVPGQQQAGVNQALAFGSSIGNLGERLTVDAGNRLLFRGTEEEYVELLRLAQIVDQQSRLIQRRYTPGPSVLNVVQAAQRLGLGETLGQGQQQQFQGGFGAQAGFNRGALGNQNQQANVDVAGFILDEPNGSFIYFGTESQHAFLEEIVDDFREQALQTKVEIKFYKLNHAEADDVAELLNEIIQDPAEQTATSPLIPGSRVGANQQAGLEAFDPNAAEQPILTEGGGINVNVQEDEVTITADEERNQIAIRASARDQEVFARLIEQLDIRQPQVMLEAQIVSVTTNDDFTFAVDVQINAGQFLLFSAFGVTSAGAPAGSEQAAQAIREISSNPPSVGGTSGGITTGLIRSDFVPVAIQALQSVGDTRIVSNPKILVRDNVEASISSTAEEPFSSTSQGGDTTITSQGGTASAGTVLNVTPRISNDGSLTLDYDVELSAFTGTGAGGLQPPTQTELYDSEVSVPSDSTVVIGGFLFEQDDRSEQKVPLLGDIPLIGELFKSTSTTKTRRTIFVFLTPRVLNDDNFDGLRLLTEGPLADMEVKGDTPKLMPARIPITGNEGLASRILPANSAARNENRVDEIDGS